MNEAEPRLNLFKLVQGILLLFLALSLICVITSVLFYEEQELLTFSSYAFTLVFFATFSHIIKSKFTNLHYSHHHLFFIWLFASLLSCIPLKMNCFHGQPCTSNLNLSIIEAIFEGTSGITSTGFSMFDDPTILPKSIQLWRSALQWIGGLGLVVWITHFFEEFKSSTSIFSRETYKINKSEKFSENIKKVSTLYTVATTTLIVLLSIKIPYWEAINHSLSIISTGGFSVTSNSFSNYSTYVLVVGIFFMIFSSLNLPLIIEIIEKRSPLDLLKNHAFIQLITLGLIGFATAIFFTESFSLKLFFNVISAITTTGLSTEPINNYSLIVLMMLANLMFVGGMIGSTAGGLKQENLLFLFKNLFRRMENKSSMNDDLDDKRLQKMLVTLFTWVLVCVGFVFIIAAIELEKLFPTEILFNIISALSNCGLSTDLISRDATPATKMIFIILMLMGRLSFFTILGSLFFFTKKVIPFTLMNNNNLDHEA